MRPALEQMQLWSPEAEELLMLTAAQESKLGTYLKQGWQKLDDSKGVALGPFMMELDTFRWLKKLYPQPWQLGGRLPEELVHDLLLAAKAARLRYLVVKEPLPKATDLQGMARYYKQYYNTELGSATVEEAMTNYSDLVKGGKL